MVIVACTREAVSAGTSFVRGVLRALILTRVTPVTCDAVLAMAVALRAFSEFRTAADIATRGTLSPALWAPVPLITTFACTIAPVASRRLREEID
jgi:hypothetical protein